MYKELIPDESSLTRKQEPFIATLIGRKGKNVKKRKEILI